MDNEMKVNNIWVDSLHHQAPDQTQTKDFHIINTLIIEFRLQNQFWVKDLAEDQFDY